MSRRTKRSGGAAAPPRRTLSNTEILAHGRDLLDPEERQRYHSLRVATLPRPCPACGRGVSQVDASGLGLDGWPEEPWPARLPAFNCPGCGVRLVAADPLIAPQGPFYWRRTDSGA